jgi:Flp pilus assembly protein TadG
MRYRKNQKGQTLIELALIIALLSVILLGITEFARAWLTKNALKNAVRQGARVAAVTPATNLTPTSFTCNQPCPNSNVLINAVCCQPGVKAGTSVTLMCMNEGGSTISCSNISSNGTVKISANYNDPNFFVVGGKQFELLGISIWPWEKSLNITVDASMRYE